MAGDSGSLRTRPRVSARQARQAAKAAIQALEQLRLALGVVPGAGALLGRAESLGQVWRWYAAEYLPRLTDAKRIRRRWEMYLEPELAPLMPWEVTPARVAKLLDQVKRGPRTINAVRETLRACIHEAAANGRWPCGNPCDAVRPRKVPRRRWPTLAAGEAAQLLVKAVEPYRSLWDVALHLGLRRGELYALTAGDVDQVARTLRVHKSHDRPCTKNGLERTIPIPAELWPTLVQLVDQAREREPAGDPLLFPAAGGGLRNRREKLTERLRSDLVRAGVVVGWDHRCRRCKSSQRLSTPLSTVCQGCGKPRRVVGVPRALRAHDLRHSFTTLALEAGADREVVRMTLGHAGDVTSIYTDVPMERQRTELEKLKLRPVECVRCGHTAGQHNPDGSCSQCATCDSGGFLPRKAEAPGVPAPEASNAPDREEQDVALLAETRNRTGDLLITNPPPPPSSDSGTEGPAQAVAVLTAVRGLPPNIVGVEQLTRAIARSFGLPEGRRVDLACRDAKCSCGAQAVLSINSRQLCEGCFNRAVRCEGHAPAAEQIGGGR